MAQTSPSEFLTFYRRLRGTSTFRHTTQCLLRPTAPSRTFASSAQRLATGGEKNIGADKTHVLDKGSKGDPNVQSYESKQGRENRATDTGGHATQQRDTRNSTEKARKEHPEAPDVIIGMQDERGGKGV